MIFVIEEFKKFAVKGNVVDMAVGIVLGMAFGNIVNSLVNDVLMPPIGLLVGEVDFANLYLNLSEQSFESLAAAREAGVPTINYGIFINTIINFLVVALVLFFFVKQINRFDRKEPGKPDEPKTQDCPYCLSTIPVAATRCPECTSNLN